VRVEGDHHRGQPQPPGGLHRPAHDALVTAVDAVEDADRHHRAPPVLRDVVQALPALHGGLLLRSPPPPSRARPALLAPSLPCRAQHTVHSPAPHPPVPRRPEAGSLRRQGANTASGRSWPSFSCTSAMSVPSGPNAATRPFAAPPAGSRPPCDTARPRLSGSRH